MIECHDNAIQIQYTRFRRKYYNLIDISRAYDMLELFHEILMYKFLAKFLSMYDVCLCPVIQIYVRFNLFGNSEYSN